MSPTKLSVPDGPPGQEAMSDTGVNACFPVLDLACAIGDDDDELLLAEQPTIAINPHAATAMKERAKILGFIAIPSL
jgi:hypothetical protein